MTTAIDTNKTVKPIAICQSDACDTLLIADANTCKGLWMGYELDWQIDPEDGNLGHDAEKRRVRRERRRVANKLLADYGFGFSTKKPETATSWSKPDFHLVAVPVMRRIDKPHSQ